MNEIWFDFFKTLKNIILDITGLIQVDIYSTRNEKKWISQKLMENVFSATN
jgi:hypothetical protein